MIDQFQPWYVGVAFSVIVTYCTGMQDMPAFMKRNGHVLDEFFKHLESKFPYGSESCLDVAKLPFLVIGMLVLRRNYLFHSEVSLSRTVYVYERECDTKHTEKLTAADLEAGAVQIAKAMCSKYKDPTGTTRKVDGDMTTLRWVPGFSPAALRLLQNMEHYGRTLPGTMEARRMMRFDTQAHRIRYGTPIFVTCSFNESHTFVNGTLFKNSKTRSRFL